MIAETVGPREKRPRAPVANPIGAVRTTIALLDLRISRPDLYTRQDLERFAELAALDRLPESTTIYIFGAECQIARLNDTVLELARDPSGERVLRLILHSLVQEREGRGRWTKAEERKDAIARANGKGIYARSDRD